MKKTKTHSNAYYKQKFKELKEYAQENNLDFYWRNAAEFQDDYDKVKNAGSKNVMKDMKYGLKYETDYKTALGEYNALREQGLLDGSVKFKDLKTMSTRDFYERYKDVIEEYRSTLKDLGFNSYSANKLVALMYFGSE